MQKQVFGFVLGWALLSIHSASAVDINELLPIPTYFFLEQIEDRLGSKFDVGKSDKTIAPDTSSAISQFQEANNLETTGLPNEETMRALGMSKALDDYSAELMSNISARISLNAESFLGDVTFTFQLDPTKANSAMSMGTKSENNATKPPDGFAYLILEIRKGKFAEDWFSVPLSIIMPSGEQLKPYTRDVGMTTFMTSGAPSWRGIGTPYLNKLDNAFSGFPATRLWIIEREAVPFLNVQIAYQTVPLSDLLSKN